MKYVEKMWHEEASEEYEKWKSLTFTNGEEVCSEEERKAFIAAYVILKEKTSRTVTEMETKYRTFEQKYFRLAQGFTRNGKTPDPAVIDQLCAEIKKLNVGRN